MEERRKFIRLKTDVKVKCEKILAELGELSDKVARTRDISGGGICLILSAREVEVGDKMSLEVNLPTGRIINLKGRVVWIEEFYISGGEQEERYDVGIEFTDIRDEDRECIKQFMSKVSGKKDAE